MTPETDPPLIGVAFPSLRKYPVRISPEKAPVIGLGSKVEKRSK